MENDVSTTTRAEDLKELWSILWPANGNGPQEAAGTARPTSAKSILKVSARHQMVDARLGSPQAYELVKRGISSRALDPLGRYLGLGKASVAQYLDLDRATVQRKVSKGEMLPMHAAESMLRLIELKQLAEDTFATPEEADAWLQRAHPMLDGEAPLERAKSAYGAQRVKDILVALKYGGAV